MKDHLKYALQRDIGIIPAILVNKDLRIVERALSGGWHYAIDNSGNIKRDIPEKDQFSHIGDCFANLVSVLLPMRMQPRDMTTQREQTAKVRRRITSYVQPVAS